MSKNKIALNRRAYKRIVAMSFDELSAYVDGLYRAGFEAGRKAATPDILIRAIREALLATEDIGPTRADAILKKLGETFAPELTNRQDDTTEKLKEIDLTNKCGTCQHFKLIEGSTNGYCTAQKYDPEMVACDKENPYPLYMRSHLKCRLYAPANDKEA